MRSKWHCSHSEPWPWEVLLVYADPLHFCQSPWEEHTRASLLIPGKEWKTPIQQPSWASSRWTKPQLTHSHVSYSHVLVGVDTDFMLLFTMQQYKAMPHLLSQLCGNQAPGWMILNLRPTNWSRWPRSTYPCPGQDVCPSSLSGKQRRQKGNFSNRMNLSANHTSPPRHELSHPVLTLQCPNFMGGHARLTDRIMLAPGPKPEKSRNSVSTAVPREPSKEKAQVCLQLEKMGRKTELTH